MIWPVAKINGITARSWRKRKKLKITIITVYLENRVKRVEKKAFCLKNEIVFQLNSIGDKNDLLF
jgi:hypothetical protein